MSAAETKAVFLSYASQDAEAARRICEALRAAGVEVWFDQSELVGGDTWDAKIRGQIASCALFVPVISANTPARRERYFRIEWRLAAQRTHAMSDDTAFLLPVVIDDTRDAKAKVPAEFRAVQWTRLRQACGGQARDDASVAAFCARVKALLGGADGSETREQLAEARAEGDTLTRSAAKKRLPSWLVPVLAGAADYLGLDQSATEPSLRAAAQRAANNWRVLMALGRKLGRAGKVDEAVEVPARADQLAGTNPMPWVDASSYFLAAGRFDEAEAAVAKSLSRRTSVRALVFDGILKLCWRGDVPAAMAAVERWPAWSLLEDRGGSIAGLVWLWARQPEKALAVYQRLPRDYLRDSFFTGPRAALTAFAHMQAGHREAAGADWQLALQVAERELAAAPGDNYALYWKAWSASQLGDRATAESISQMLEQRDWTTPSFHSPEAKRAGLLLALARPDDALAFLRTTLARESRDRRVEFKNQFVNYRLTRAVLNTFVMTHRALVAHLLGKKDEARRFAD